MGGVWMYCFTYYICDQLCTEGVVPVIGRLWLPILCSATAGLTARVLSRG